jgi:outer membrane protein assembly factor BamB
MKKLLCLILTAVLCLGLSGCGIVGGAVSVMLVVLALGVLALSLLRTYNYLQYRSRMLRRKNRKKPIKPMDILTIGMYVLAAVLLMTAVLIPKDSTEDPAQTTNGTTTEATTVVTEPPIVFKPGMTAASDPAIWGIRWETFQGNTSLTGYQRPEPITFGEPEEYFALPGISTFRGNNYRDSATYGTADITQQTVETVWTVDTKSLDNWTGSGWTGQPLIVRWDGQTKNIMNLYDEKKVKSNLVEVIYATLDGHIYFLDLEDGSATRPAIYVGMCFKGAGTLDPRGYPLMYVGSGDSHAGKQSRMYIISLISGQILYEYGNDDPLSLRKDNDNWCAFDSSPLVDAETDTLIWPGENGLLYTIKLNTSYNKDTGHISIAPDVPVLSRYTTSRSGESKYWYGFEASANIVENYLYVSENGGMFYCVDLNTMELVWAQDTKDDSNCSPAFQRTAEDQGYVYTAPSLHWTKDAQSRGSISLYKLDAMTGEILWEMPYHVYTVDGVSGGVQSSPLLGKEGSSIDGLIIYTISRTPSIGSGILVALDTQTGREVWRMDMNLYAWSSPVAFYNDGGKACVAVCDSGGNLFLVDGATGELLDQIHLGSLVEASPAVYEDMLVVGTRGRKICGVKIS